MYELSALLCGIRKECSGAFKKKIIMSVYRNTSVNTDFYFLNMNTLSVKLLPIFSIIFQEFPKNSHSPPQFLQVIQTALKIPLPLSCFCFSAHVADVKGAINIQLNSLWVHINVHVTHGPPTELLMLWRVEIRMIEHWNGRNSSLNLFIYLLQDLTDSRKCNNWKKCNNKSGFKLAPLSSEHWCTWKTVVCRTSTLLTVQHLILLPEFYNADICAH